MWLLGDKTHAIERSQNPLGRNELRVADHTIAAPSHRCDSKSLRYRPDWVSRRAHRFTPAGYQPILNDKSGALAAANTPMSQAGEVEEVGSEEL